MENSAFGSRGGSAMVMRRPEGNGVSWRRGGTRQSQRPPDKNLFLSIQTHKAKISFCLWGGFIDRSASFRERRRGRDYAPRELLWWPLDEDISFHRAPAGAPASIHTEPLCSTRAAPQFRPPAPSKWRGFCVERLAGVWPRWHAAAVSFEQRWICVLCFFVVSHFIDLQLNYCSQLVDSGPFIGFREYQTPADGR